MKVTQGACCKAEVFAHSVLAVLRVLVKLRCFLLPFRFSKHIHQLSSVAQTHLIPRGVGIWSLAVVFPKQVIIGVCAIGAWLPAPELGGVSLFPAPAPFTCRVFFFLWEHVLEGGKAAGGVNGMCVVSALLARDLSWVCFQKMGAGFVSALASPPPVLEPQPWGRCSHWGFVFQAEWRNSQGTLFASAPEFSPSESASP